MKRLTTLTFLLVLLGTAVSHGRSQVDLVSLSLEELLEVEVFSAARQVQPLFETPAAVEVITGEQIRRSGVLRLPQALRLATGVHVKHIDASKWAITVRGFANRFANKLLVLVDGRTVYSPLFAGVLWETQDLLLDNVERIEVVRGPGGALWGANAVNGVINVITRPAVETQGTSVWVGGGQEERGYLAARRGGALDPHTTYRVYGKAFRRDALEFKHGASAADDWHQLRGGFRLDRERGGRHWMLTGAAYDGRVGQTMEEGVSLSPPYETRYEYRSTLRGSHLLARHVRSLGDDSELRLSGYYDAAATRDTVFNADWQTVGIDLQHCVPVGQRQTVIWGGEARTTWDDIEATHRFSMDPARRRTWIVSGFAQSEVRLADPRWRLVLGAKVERNDYTGVELLPSARAVFSQGQRYTAWVSAARAVRLPTRAEADGIHLNAVTPLIEGAEQPLLLTRLIGNPDMDSEKLEALEFGLRWRPAAAVTLDGAVFFNRYDRHLSGEPELLISDTMATPQHVVLALTPSNLASGHTMGGEINAEWRVTEQCRLSGGYAYLNMDLGLDPASNDPGSLEFVGDSPRHRANGRAALSLPHQAELDLMLTYLGRLPYGWDDRILALDAHLAWRPTPRLELCVTGLDLLGHGEGGMDPELIDTELTYSQRNVYLTACWQLTPGR